MPLVRKPDGWWVTQTPNRDCPEYGPYDNKLEAEEARDRCRKFFRENPNYYDDPA